MSFFEQQAKAKRNTKTLLAVFGLTVFGIICAVHTIIVTVISGNDGGLQSSFGENLISPELFFGTSTITLLIIAGGSLFKLFQLRAGGSVIAQELGGQLVSPDTQEYKHRQLLNIVEEMSIASGTPVPPVYVIPESSINAFAAGYALEDAVIGVTEGCLRTLSRDELQGVIAHEFSHILNGDMRLNIRLIGVLQGLLIIALIGRMLCNSQRRRRYSSSNSKNNGGGVVAIGFALLVVGWIGVLGGRLIKAAVSRQREFLADASAVQFTRNPNGISGALQKIGGYVFGSSIEHPRAEEASHMFFGNGLGKSWFALMATHPPLPMRIKRIDPSFKGVFPMFDESYVAPDEEAAHSSFASGGAPASKPTATTSSTETPAPEAVMSSIGNPSEAHLEAAKRVIAALPLKLHQNLHSMGGAQGVILALLTSKEEECAAKQRAALEATKNEALLALYDENVKILSSNENLKKLTLPMIDLSLPALSLLDKNERESFLKLTREFVLADGAVSLFEYMLHKTFQKHLTGKVQTRDPSLEETTLKEGVGRLFAVGVSLASNMHSDTAEAALLEKAMKPFNTAADPALLSQVKGKELENLDLALTKLTDASFEQKEKILEGLSLIILSDSTVSITEAEFFRAVAATLDCPVPPVLGTAS